MVQPSITWPEIVTALVAGAAFVLSIVSLTVQYILWRNSGARVRVTCAHSFIAWSPMNEPQHVLSVEASNRGRESTQVASWWLEPKRAKLNWWFKAPVPGSTPLPSPLAPGHKLIWMADWAEVIRLAKGQRVQKLRAGILLGSGEKIKGNWLNTSTWLADEPHAAADR
jgi:hypothetical protein